MKAMRKIKKFLKGFGIFLVLLGIGLAVWLGFINPKRVIAQARSTTSQAVSSIGIGDSSSSNSDACALKCRENLTRIQSAKRSLASKGQFATGTETFEGIWRELGVSRPLVCPCGGNYVLGTNEQLVRCTKGTGGNTSAVDDHVIKQ